MKSRILSVLAALAAFLTALGAADLSGLINLFPDDVASVLATALPALAGVVHLLKAFGDFLDDGKINGSFPLFVAIATLGLMTSCATRVWSPGPANPGFDVGKARSLIDVWEAAAEIFPPNPDHS